MEIQAREPALALEIEAKDHYPNDAPLPIFVKSLGGAYSRRIGYEILLPQISTWIKLLKAFYPIGSEIPATRLTKIWIAEGETLEDTANKYLEEFVQRSLVWVSRRSSSGTIKYFQVPRVIHEFVQVTCDTEFLHVNPTNDNGMNRVVILPDNNNQYREVKIDHLRCFIASDLDRDVLGTCPYLRVLELRNSTIRDTILTKLYYLQHLGLRGNNISTLPENINNMKYLQTLDVRDTKV
ncbi:disease resistance protein Pik-2-like isoform X2 [Carex rostrata]